MVIHKDCFVNEEGEHTNSVESVWSQLKNWWSFMHGVRRDHYQSYMSEFMYRYNYCGGSRNDCWAELLEDIKILYPFEQD